MSEIVVTGIGAVTPLGVGASVLNERWCAGDNGIVDGLGACTDFIPTDHLTVKEARRADRFTQLALVAGDEAIASAGWKEKLPYDGERIACVIGTGVGGIGTTERGKDIMTERGPEMVPPLSIPLLMPNAAPAALAMRYKLLGPSFGVVSACAAGTHAIGSALRTLQCGDADAVVTGGAEAGITPIAHAAFASLDAMSHTGISRPFDLRRDGFVLAEGAAILVLERREDAEARGAEIFAIVRGYGASSDAFHLTAPDADGAGATRAIRAALKDAGLDPTDVDYINAHGTSTQLNDRTETLAIKSALGDHAYKIPVSSTKSAIGHSLGAAGAIEAVATILALRDRVAGPTIGYEQPDSDLDLDYVPGKARPLNVNGKAPIALSNSFGFGGHNGVLCLEAV